MTNLPTVSSSAIAIKGVAPSGMRSTTAKAAVQPKRAASLRNRDSRFGDEATPSSAARPDRDKPHFATSRAPLHTLSGFPYHPRTAGRGDQVGSSATQVSKWQYEGRGKSLRPHEHDYLGDLAPGRYLGLAHPLDRKGASWYIGPGGPRLRRAQSAAGETMVVLPPSIGKQSLSTCHTEPSLTFGRIAEGRLEQRRPLNKEQAESQASLWRRQRRSAANPSAAGPAVESAEREQLVQLNRAVGVEEGGHTAAVYMPGSTFGRTSAHASASASFGSMTTSRFDAASATPPPRSASLASLASTPPPHGGFLGVAFRTEPVATPGPGSYTVDRGFDGRGTQKLSQSPSEPCISMTGKKESFSPLRWRTVRGRHAEPSCRALPRRAPPRPAAPDRAAPCRARPGRAARITLAMAAHLIPLLWQDDFPPPCSYF